jgi:hypothetical protein
MSAYTELADFFREHGKARAQDEGKFYDKVALLVRRYVDDAEKPMKRLREHLSKLCDEMSATLDKAAPGNDQNFWGGRLRLAQELAQKIDAGDFADKPEVPVRSCNRHSNCGKAEDEMKARGKEIFANFHCHDDGCEDCFGK